MLELKITARSADQAQLMLEVLALIAPKLPVGAAVLSSESATTASETAAPRKRNKKASGAAGGDNATAMLPVFLANGELDETCADAAEWRGAITGRLSEAADLGELEALIAANPGPDIDLAAWMKEAAAAARASHDATPAIPDETDAKADEATASAPAETAETAASPKAEAAPTKEAVQALVRAYCNAKGTVAGITLLKQEFGVDRVSGMKPEDYPKALIAFRING